MVQAFQPAMEVVSASWLSVRLRLTVAESCKPGTNGSGSVTGTAATIRRMATLNQKVEAERRVREWLGSEGIPQPDEVEYGYTCVRFFFRVSKTCLVFDIDEIDVGGNDP
jgi:hypothetical protein